MRRTFVVSLWLVVLAVALSLVLIAATVYTYHRLTAETVEAADRAIEDRR